MVASREADERVAGEESLPIGGEADEFSDDGDGADRVRRDGGMSIYIYIMGKITIKHPIVYT